MSKEIRFKGIVATLAQIAADAFAGRISWASDLARPVHYYTDSDYAVLARKDVAETFPGVKITNQAGPVARMVQAGTDGTQSAVSAATARATIGAQEALGYTPVNKAGDTMTGGLTLTSLVNSATAGVGIRPKVALADGTDAVQDAATFRGTIGAVKTPVVWRQSAIVGSGVSTETTWTTIAVNMDYPIDFWYYTGGGTCTLRIYNEVKSASTLIYTASLPASNALYHMRIVFDSVGALAEIGDTRVILTRPDFVNFSGTFIITAQGSGGVGECLVPRNLTYTAA